MHTEILTPVLSSSEVDALWKGKWVKRHQATDYRFFRGGSPMFRTPEGKLIAWLMPNLFSPAEQQARFIAWAKMRGDLSNRQAVFPTGSGAFRETKNGVSTLKLVRPDILNVTGGSAIKVGMYRENKRIAGKADCHMTVESHRYPKIFAQAYHDSKVLSAAYREYLPTEYAQQMEYINSVPQTFRFGDTAFTTVYGIRNHPTACHRDEGDIPTGTGVLTTCGQWHGNEFILPELRLAFDLRPSDALFVDVHMLHGNLPKISGERIAQVYFARVGMERCAGLD